MFRKKGYKTQDIGLMMQHSS